MIVSAEIQDRVAELKEYYPDSKSAVMPILQLVQEQFGLISQEAVSWVAEQVEMSPVHVEELVSFYSMYTTEPRGKYHIQLCRTLSCAVLGMENILQDIQEYCQIGLNEVSANSLWSVELVECLGSCGSAPMCQINDHFFENLDSEKMKMLLKQIEEEQPDLSFSTLKNELGNGLNGRPKSEVYQINKRAES